jgi:hypothetical protein
MCYFGVEREQGGTGKGIEHIVLTCDGVFACRI